MRFLRLPCHPFLLSCLLLTAVTTGAQSPYVPASERQQSSSNEVVFLSPRDGAIFRPGETVHIELSVSPSAKIPVIVIISDLGFSNERRESPPYSFTLTIPEENRVMGSGPLIGTHTITAFGRVEGKNGYELAAIEVDIETPEMPVKLSAETNSIRRNAPGEMRFFWAGNHERLQVFGRFPNRKELDLTGSTHIRFHSGNPKIIRVSGEGTVTSVGPGTTSVVATYSLGKENIRLVVPVTVEVPETGIIPTPPMLDFGSQAVGTTSPPLRVTVTNRWNSRITIYKLQTMGNFSETDDCTAAPLAEGGTCTITFRFTPQRSGKLEDTIDLPNSFSQASSILLSGIGK